MLKVSVKWGKQKFDNIELNTNEPPTVFKAQVFALTGVPPDRQKIMGVKGGILKDDANWSTLGVKEGHSFMLIGSAEEVKAPEKPTVFLEDLPAEDMDIDSIGLPPGLHNLGNTCYLNSTLQMLHGLPELQKALVKQLPAAGGGAAGGGGAGDQMGSVASSLKELFVQMNNSQKAVGPLMFVQLFRTVFPQFAQQSSSGSFKQQDADEALTTLLTTVNQKLPKSDDKRTAVERLFQGEMVTSYSCTETDEKLEKPETFMKLSCNIGSTTSFLLEGLRESLKEDITKRSEKLGRDAKWVKLSRVAHLPYAVTVQFVRFFWGSTSSAVNKESIAKKIVRPVEFPMVLDLFDFCTDDLKKQLEQKRKQISEEEEEKMKKRAEEIKSGLVDKEKEKQRKKQETEEKKKQEDLIAEDPSRWVNNTGRYELCGVVTHKGRAADSGHYIGWVKDASDRWVKFDDETVSIVNEEEIKKLSGKGGGDWHIAYLCMYRTRPGL
jgi:ubiquitin carboxyl-terminal hydrolase 14